ncbi:MAG TPA: bifunctional glutamate N-acetyltransferase/amino-acid acetyltransferase ArgJ [Gemmatimonadaceae bacterium]|nr:bifunctional glutamate N-acetyltransferase/amino-acid acetyltransferase ArgJ [Gemmatimonadaceae bacterium]
MPAEPAITFHAVARFPRGFRCASRNVGLKADAPDLVLFTSEVDASAAAVFTRNLFPGAPVVLGRETIKGGRLRGIVANSKVSNVATGDAGLQNAKRMAAAAAKELGTSADRMLVSSTGVIGVQLPIERIETGLSGIATDLQDDPLVGAQAIMTTDTRPKTLSTSVGDATITWVAKGAGMIEPNMATMLAYIFTDADLPAATLDGMLRAAARVSFNMLSVDSDTSTSDTCAILANGLAGEVDTKAFSDALIAGCIRMAEMLARDGEGATRLLRICVRGAKTATDARRIAKSLVNSPLVKTMVHGADPNVGRILMAVGKCFDATVVPAKTSASINGLEVVKNGMRADFSDQSARATLATDPVDIIVDLGVGGETATAFGCDLSRGYIEENAAYYST